MGHGLLTSLKVLAAFPAVLLAGQPLSRAFVAIPEPADMALFGIGVAGLLIGRRAAAKRSDRGSDEGE